MILETDKSYRFAVKDDSAESGVSFINGIYLGAEIAINGCITDVFVVYRGYAKRDKQAFNVKDLVGVREIREGELIESV